ncbi:ATP-dependent zinc metalloprotease FtsH [Chloroflexota bacterium]
MKTKRQQAFLYLLVLAAIVILVFVFLPRGEGTPEGTLSELVEYAKEGEVASIVQKGDTLIAIGPDDKELLKANFDGNTWELREYLQSEQVDLSTIDIKYEPQSGFNWGTLFLTLLPFILIIGLFWFILRGARGASNQAFNFSRSKARLLTGTRPTVTFADVAGVEEAKTELQEIVEFLRSADKFLALGARIPRGVLLIGPPGTGKTLLARAIAGEAEVPYFSISGSEFVEMFVGVGASRVRDLFDQAKRNAPCIIFVDEIDAVGRHRGAGLGGGHDEREQTLNQILVEMDGFDSSTNIIILAATNRPDILDPALLRPGRFDRQVILDRPDINGRKGILEVHTKGKPLEDSADLETIAKETVGFSGADLANLVNEAAILAARRDKKAIGFLELEEAVDRVVAGPEKKSRVINPKEKEMIAYHEAGHALVARRLPNADPVHKVSIIARGMMGGYTKILPAEDRYLSTRSQLMDQLSVLLGGHAAEDIIFSERTTGPHNDIERATKIARSMVTELGMSDKLGPRTFGHKESLVFLGKEISEQRDYSDRTALEIDREVDSIIEKAYETARDVLTKENSRLSWMAQRLIIEESLDGEVLHKLFDDAVPPPSEWKVETKGEKPPPPDKEETKSQQDDVSNPSEEGAELEYEEAPPLPEEAPGTEKPDSE